MTSRQKPVLEIFDDINSKFERARVGRDPESDDSFIEGNAESRSTAYIQSFWPHVADAISADPAKLGLSVVGTCLLYTSPSPRDQRGSGVAGSG